MNNKSKENERAAQKPQFETRKEIVKQRLVKVMTLSLYTTQVAERKSC